MNVDSQNLAVDGGRLADLRQRAAKNPEGALREVAEQFEAVLTQQLLEAMRSTSFGDDGMGRHGGTYRDMFDAQIAQKMATSGRGLGIADQLVAQLRASGVGAGVADQTPDSPANAAVNGHRALTAGMAAGAVQGTARTRPGVAEPGSTAPSAAGLAKASAPGTGLAGYRLTSTPDSVSAQGASAAADKRDMSQSVAAYSAPHRPLARAMGSRFPLPADPVAAAASVARASGGSAPATPTASPATFTSVSMAAAKAAAPAAAPASGVVARARGFVDGVLPHAQRAAEALGVPVRAVLAHAALESGWGRHAPGDNFFGIKADSAWQGPRARLETREFSGGRVHERVEGFRQYAGAAQSFADYAAFLKSNPRYQGALAAARPGDGLGFLRAVARAGYATDPAYAQKLESVYRSPLLNEALAANASGDRNRL